MIKDFFNEFDDDFFFVLNEIFMFLFMNKCVFKNFIFNFLMQQK